MVAGLRARMQANFARNLQLQNRELIEEHLHESAEMQPNVHIERAPSLDVVEALERQLDNLRGAIEGNVQ